MAHFMNSNQVPYLKTEPLHVVFRAKAKVGDLAFGYYDWTLASSTVYGNPRVDLNPANLYAIEHFTFSADVSQEDYSASIIDDSAAPGGTIGVPRFHLYVDSEKGGPILLQPIPIPQFYQQAAFPKWRLYTKENSESDTDPTSGISNIGFLGIKSTNQFQGAFEARLAQSGPLIGKQTISLIFAFDLLEIRDEAFIADYRGQIIQGGAYHGE